MLYLPSEAEIEVRQEGSKLRLGGYAFKWFTPANLFPGLREQFAKGSVSARAIKDVGLNVEQHLSGYIARTTAGDLDVRADDVGLRWDATLDAEDSEHVNVHRRAARGVYGGSSVGFRPATRGIKREMDAKGNVLATVEKVAMIQEITVVNRPIYASSSVEARSMREFMEAGNPAPAVPVWAASRTRALRAAARSRR